MDPKEMLRVDLEGRIAHSRLGHPDHTSVRRYPDAIAELGNELRELIIEAHFERSREFVVRPDRLPDTLSMLREDPSHVRAYARQCGISTGVIASERFSGTWCLATARAGESDHQVLATRSALDPASALRANLSEIIAASVADPKGRQPDAEHDLTCRLHHAVDDWEATLKGHHTPRTFGELHMRKLGRTDPSLQPLVAAALGGDAAARQECLSAARFEDLERDRQREPISASWSMWTSKGHPADARLVITRSAIDALSYHQLHPHTRTRYVSFDGAETPARDTRLDRALAIMPQRSVIVVAADRSREGQGLADAVQTLATRHPSLRVDHHSPQRATWNLDLQTRSREFQSPAARSLALPAATRAMGLER